jgi:hypothetical protein
VSFLASPFKQAIHFLPTFRAKKTVYDLAFSQDWIFESHKQRKLVDIEPFLMHAGKPWRKNKEPIKTDQGDRYFHQKYGLWAQNLVFGCCYVCP